MNSLAKKENTPNKPKLRFKSFSGGWMKERLGDFLIQHSEKTTRNKQYPVLTSSQIGIFLQKDYFAGKDIASADTTGYNVVPRGFFTYRHMSDNLVFKFNINTIVDKGIVSTLYPVFTTKNLNDKFLLYLLNEGREFKKYAVLQKQGGSRTYMYYSKLKELEVTIPELSEQNKVASFLEEVNVLIEKIRREKELLQKYKKGITQKIFSQELRFKTDDNSDFPAWRNCTLGDLFNERAEKNGTHNHDLLSVSLNNGVTKQGSGEKRDSSSLDKSNYKVVYKNDIAYNTMRMWQGAYGVSPFTGIVSPAYTVVFPKQGSVDFYKYLFRQPRTIFNFYRYSQGMTSDTWNLKFHHFSEIEVEVPESIVEQEKIASFLNSIDELVVANQKKLTKAEEWKKGLMQQLFI